MLINDIHPCFGNQPLVLELEVGHLHYLQINNYRKVANSSMSCVVAPPQVLGTFMKGQFDLYLL